MTGILKCMNTVKMEQIYKNLYKDDLGRYMFLMDDDTKYVVEQQSYLLSYIIEILLQNSIQGGKSGDLEWTS